MGGRMIFRWLTLAGLVIAGLSTVSLAADPLAVYGDPAAAGGLHLPGEACPPLAVYRELTLAALIDQTLCRHPQTREVWANARSQAALLGAARGAWLPGANARLAEERVDNGGATVDRRSASLTLSWLLYDFGARQAAESAARSLYEAAQATRNHTVQSLLAAAMQAYYAAQAGQAALAASREAERAAGEAANAAETRYRIGVATPADRLQARTAHSQATLNRVRAEGNLRTAVGVLANAMGLEATQGLILPAALPSAVDRDFRRDVDALIAQARAERADLRAAEGQWQAARSTADKIAADGRPSLAVAATPTWQNISGLETRGNTLGLTLTVPLFSGFDTLYRTQAAQATAEARLAQRDRLASQIALEVWRAYQALTTAAQAVDASRDLLASATASEAMALGRYKAGVGSVLDLLNAQSALAAARAQDVQAGFDWLSARVALAFALGRLDATTPVDVLLEK